MVKHLKLKLLLGLSLFTLPFSLSPLNKAEACGNTTYVHSSLNGNRTAYGYVWNSRELTAAARNRNLRGAVVTLRRAGTNRTVTVRITDYSPNSEFDLSATAFQQLGRLSEGRLCTVRI